MEYSDEFTNFLIENKIPVAKHLEACDKVLNGLKPRYFKIPFKYTLSDTFGYKRVSWLRDVELYEIGGKFKIPDNAVGLDAASAASVEALRLSCLADRGDVTVLDMCCAPGGKLLAAASTLAKILPENGQARLIGIDSSYRRLQVCKSFLLKEELPSKIDVKLVCEDSLHVKPRGEYRDIVKNVEFELPSSYDRVIVDVECSHEGSMRSTIRTFTYWDLSKLKSKWLNREYIDNLVETQYKLLNKAIDLCKPGGIVVYSTCSLISKENEGIINKVLSRRNDVKPAALPIRNRKRNRESVEKFEDCIWPASPILLDRNATDEPSAVLFDVTNTSSTTDGQFIASLIKV